VVVFLCHLQFDAGMLMMQADDDDDDDDDDDLSKNYSPNPPPLCRKDNRHFFQIFMRS